MRNDEYGIDGSTAILTNRKPRKGLELSRDIWRLKTQVAEYGGALASSFSCEFPLGRASPTGLSCRSRACARGCDPKFLFHLRVLLASLNTRPRLAGKKPGSFCPLAVSVSIWKVKDASCAARLGTRGLEAEQPCHIHPLGVLTDEFTFRSQCRPACLMSQENGTSRTGARDQFAVRNPNTFLDTLT
jgi:hypothetical protein